MATYGLGNKFNYVHIADSVVVPLSEYGAATVFVYESNAETVVDFKRRKDGGSPVDVPDNITEYWTSNGAGGAWTRQTQTADDGITKSTGAATSLAAIEYTAGMLTSDGSDYDELEVEVDGSAVVSIILHDVKNQRAPQNLPAIV